MTISARTRKVLWGKSGNRCAICNCLLTEGSDADQSEIPIGAEAHIISGRPDGPRHAPLPKNQQDAVENLILLCPTHHKVVDDRDRTGHWTVDQLRNLKTRHEASVAKKTARKRAADLLPGPLAHAEAADYVQKRNRHHEQLREFLGRVPHGKPAGSLLWDDLQEHLGYRHAIWSLEEHLRTLVVAAGRHDATSAKLFDEEMARGLVLSGGQAILSDRLHAAIDGREQTYPDVPWFVEDGRLLKFGGAYGIAYVRNWDEAAEISKAQRDMWEEIPLWPEVIALRQAARELSEVRADLGRELAELYHSPDFPPGRCRHCPRVPDL